MNLETYISENREALEAGYAEHKLEAEQAGETPWSFDDWAQANFLTVQV